MSASGRLAKVLRTFGPAWLASHTLSALSRKSGKPLLFTKRWPSAVSLKPASSTGRFGKSINRNRHGPTCQPRVKKAWWRARRQELLPVPYFHRVFTLPHVLNDLNGRHGP